VRLYPPVGQTDTSKPFSQVSQGNVRVYSDASPPHLLPTAKEARKKDLPPTLLPSVGLRLTPFHAKPSKNPHFG